MVDKDKTPTEAPKKHAGGRPQKWTPDNIAKLQAYIDKCPDIVPSLAGFSIAAKINRNTLDKWCYNTDLELDNYDGLAEFRRMLGDLNSLQEVTMLNSGASRAIDSGIAKLVLSKHGYRTSTDVTTNGESIKPSISIG